MRKIFTCVLAAALLASLTACGNSANAADSDYIYGQIDSVSGNDIVLLLAEYNENADESSESKAEDSASDKDTGTHSGGTKRERPEGFTKPENGEMPEGFDPSQFSGEMPEGFDPSQFGSGMPGGFSRSKKNDSESGADTSESDESKSGRKRPEGFSGEMPEGFDPSQFSGEMPEGFDPSQFVGEMPEGFYKSQFGRRTKQSADSRYTLTGEQETLRIPVGTTVTTALGVETDFDVLHAGDMIKCTVEKDSDGNDVITAVWILEQ